MNLWFASAMMMGLVSHGILPTLHNGVMLTMSGIQRASGHNGGIIIR